MVRLISASGRQEDLYCDQDTSKKCYVSAIRNLSKLKQVHWTEVPNALVLEDDGPLPKRRLWKTLLPYQSMMTAVGFS